MARQRQCVLRVTQPGLQEPVLFPYKVSGDKAQLGAEEPSQLLGTKARQYLDQSSDQSHSLLPVCGCCGRSAMGSVVTLPPV